MSHDPTRNPTVTGGRRSGFVLGVVAHRKFRADATAERNLTTLGHFLAGEAEADKPSVSMILRRAVAAYADHCRAIANDEGALARERRRVRQGAKIPKVKTAPK